VSFLSELPKLGKSVDLSKLLEQIPYASLLGMHVEQKGREITTILPFKDSNVGNPMLPALHGGVISGFLETTAILELLSISDVTSLPKPIDVSIDYLRSGRAVDTYARAVVTKHGRRVSNVQVEAWQDDHQHPIARLHGHFFLSPLTRDEKT
jgi:uncharacterized protein (TIGR00369 family)